MKASGRCGYVISSFGTGRRGRAAFFAALALLATLAFGAGSASAATPELKIDPTVLAGYTSVEFSGEVDPNGDPVEWYVEKSTDGGANWEFGEVLGSSEEDAPQPITNAVLGGLAQGTTYKIRISAFDYATEEFLATPEPSPEFTTKSVTAPTVSLDPITTKTDTTAHLSGHVDPNSPGGLDEAGKAAYLTTWQFHCTPDCPGLEPHELDAEAGNTEVSADVSGLEPNTSYEVTLTATNVGGEGTDAPQGFSTDEIAPSVNSAPGSALGGGKFQLAGTVNPHNSAITSCVFEYGLTDSYGQTAPCETTPATVNKRVFVTAEVTGLTIGTEYHFRLTATNGAGPTSSDDGVFTPSPTCANEAIRGEQGSSFLPECRAWEQVSAPFKAGFLVSSPQYNDDGDRVVYASVGNFNGNENGNSAAGNPYLATRSPTGWATEATNPPAPHYLTSLSAEWAFAADLRSSIFQISTADQGIEAADLYRRDENGALERIGPWSDPAEVPPSAPGGSPNPGASRLSLSLSADLSRIVLSRGGRLFEYGPGIVDEAVPVDVDNEGHQIGSCEETVGARARANGALSQDGRVLFWADACANPNGAGELYARIGATTIAVSAPRCTGSCLPGPVDSEFIGAAADGSVAYFQSSDQLLDEDTDETRDIYACRISPGVPTPVGQFNACDSLTDVTKGLASAEVRGPVAVSEDGTHVYFIAKGILVGNVGANEETAAAGANNLYLWQRDAQHPQGEMKFLAQIDDSDQELWGANILDHSVGGETTPDGRYLVLAVHTPLIDSGPQADTDGGAVDIYRYDADTGLLARISTDSSGSGGNTGGAGAAMVTPPGSARPSSRTHPAISSNGESIVFWTNEKLSSFDHNDSRDVYLWNPGTVALISGGRVSDVGAFTKSNSRGEITPDGTAVLFVTADRLAPSDTDTQFDLYEARVEGGFPSSAVSPPCSGESSCRAGSPSTPGSVTPSSSSSTSGNPIVPPRCRKGKVRRHGHCVPRRQKAHRKKKHRHRSPTAKRQGHHTADSSKGGAK